MNEKTPEPVVSTTSEQTIKFGIVNNSKEFKNIIAKDTLRVVIQRDALLIRSNSTSSSISDDSSSSSSCDSIPNADQNRHTDEQESNCVENLSVENNAVAVKHADPAGYKTIFKPTTKQVKTDNIPQNADSKLLASLNYRSMATRTSIMSTAPLKTTALVTDTLLSMPLKDSSHSKHVSFLSNFFKSVFPFQFNK